MPEAFKIIEPSPTQVTAPQTFEEAITFLEAMTLTQERIQVFKQGQAIDFRDGQFGYFPDRIVEETPPFEKLEEIINNHLRERLSDYRKIVYRKLLRDLIIHNAYGKIFPIPDSTADFVGVVDLEKISGRTFNCIVLTKAGDELAIAGGFNYVGEAITQTAARKANQELGANTVTACVFFDEESDPFRDPRKVIPTTAFAGLVDHDEIRSSGKETYIFPLYDPETHEFIDDYMQPTDDTEPITDLTGKQLIHKGMRADHAIILKKLYNYWKENSEVVEEGQVRRMSLSETLQKMKRTTPQTWFNNYKTYDENYVTLQVGKSAIILTPNVQFVIDETEKIFSAYRLDNARERAQRFAADCVIADILPVYPQPAVTVDCVIVKSDQQGDKLIVMQKKDGKLALPGRFYSPTIKEAKQKGLSIETFARAVVASEFDASFNPCVYLGCVGGEVANGLQADPRYPRFSHVYAGIITGAYEPTVGEGLPEGAKIIEIPIWEDRASGKLSREILDGLDGQGWAYAHNTEILIPLLSETLKTLDPSGSMTAEQVMIRRLH